MPLHQCWKCVLLKSQQNRMDMTFLGIFFCSALSDHILDYLHSGKDYNNSLARVFYICKKWKAWMSWKYGNGFKF